MDKTRKIKVSVIKDGIEDILDISEKDGEIKIRKNGKLDEICKGILTLHILILKLEYLENRWLAEPSENTLEGYLMAIRSYYDRIEILEGDLEEEVYDEDNIY